MLLNDIKCYRMEALGLRNPSMGFLKPQKKKETQTNTEQDDDLPF